MHWSVTGMSGAGKSRFMREYRIPAHRRAGTRVAVLDPLGQSWPADYVTTDPDQFLSVARASRSIVLVIDEYAHFTTDYRTMRALEWCFTMARNHGHLSYALAQRLMMIPPNVRNQCANAVVFRQASRDLDDLAALLDQPAIIRASTFPPGHALIVKPFAEPVEVRTF
jgi:hypothetical protein